MAKPKASLDGGLSDSLVLNLLRDIGRDISRIKADITQIKAREGFDNSDTPLAWPANHIVGEVDQITTQLAIVTGFTSEDEDDPWMISDNA